MPVYIEKETNGTWAWIGWPLELDDADAQHAMEGMVEGLYRGGVDHIHGLHQVSLVLVAADELTWWYHLSQGSSILTDGLSMCV
jgi:hypothetical protein